MNKKLRIKSKPVLELTYTEAKAFFMKQESYCDIDLPNYFNFQKLLNSVSSLLDKKELCYKQFTKNGRRPSKCSNIKHIHPIKRPSELEGVNYTLLSNKDGNLAWRPLELINPVCYVELVNTITSEANWKKILSRFKQFKKSSIECVSVPRMSENEQTDKASNIINWWSQIEQKSLKLALNYQYMFDTDISNCYGSIYTHSIAWAVEGKNAAKKRRNDHALLGDKIDIGIRNMRNGQTNGIPQGSTLMDFIAEIVIGYIDVLITAKIKDFPKCDYNILRYRDDYRIFTNDYDLGVKIVKVISETLSEFGMKLNASKTKESDDIILSSVKSEKIDNLLTPKDKSSLQKWLLRIYKFSEMNPNTGVLCSLLDEVYNYLSNNLSKQSSKQRDWGDKDVLLSIVVNLWIKNPRIVSQCSAIISVILSRYTEKQQQLKLSEILTRISYISNTTIHELWMQRISSKIDLLFNYNSTISQYAHNSFLARDKGQLWNITWLPQSLKSKFRDNHIIDIDEWKKSGQVISNEEYELLKRKADEYLWWF